MRSVNILFLVLFSLSASGQGEFYSVPTMAQAFISAQYSNSVSMTGNDIERCSKLDLRINNNMTDSSGTYVRVTDSMPALYPMIGNTFASQKLNFINPDLYALTSVGSPISSDTGMVFNGTSNYVNTGFSSSLKLMGLGIYMRTNNNGGNGVNIGFLNSTAGTDGLYLQIRNSGTGKLNYNTNSGNSNFVNASTLGYWEIIRTSQTSHSVYLNGSVLNTSSVNSNTPLNIPIYIGAANNVAVGVSNFTAMNAGCAFITTGQISPSSINRALVNFNTTATIPR